jgi:hypothetical protein
MARGHGTPSASARPRRPAPVPVARRGGAARRPAPPRPVRGPGSPPAPACPVPPASACPAPARRSRGVSASACLWRAALSSANARTAQSAPACARPVRYASVRRACSRGACGALARLAMPSACSSTPRRARLPPVYPMRSDRVIYINKWKLDLEIGYVSYFM